MHKQLHSQRATGFAGAKGMWRCSLVVVYMGIGISYPCAQGERYTL
jgi:hypothetical protein